LGEKILRICDEDFRFSAGEQLNFIVAGPKSPDSKELQVYRLRTQRIRHPELVKGGFAIDGSGAQFVGNALTRDSQQGLSVNTQFLSIADIAITLYDHGIVATRSSGVNDELQYGFLVNGKTATLIHPRITLSQAPKEYQGEHGEIDMTKVEENKKFYQNFDGTLRKAAELERAVKNITANLIKGHPGLTPENAYEMIEERRIQLQGLERQLNNMIVDYVEHHNP
ncbi:TPA: hypothetical protein HA278_00115, partial [Candidatus Woesearchaeota archaeon]|nr:hypothetical protein [Candidatus Woesearchaeota archaeon]